MLIVVTFGSDSYFRLVDISRTLDKSYGLVDVGQKGIGSAVGWLI
jgi:hypothetical protein